MTHAAKESHSIGCWHCTGHVLTDTLSRYPSSHQNTTPYCHDHFRNALSSCSTVLTFVFVSPHAVSNFMSKSLTAYTSDRIAPMIIKSVVMIDDIFDRVVTIHDSDLRLSSKSPVQKTSGHVACHLCKCCAAPPPPPPLTPGRCHHMRVWSSHGMPWRPQPAIPGMHE